ncbi:Uncharacterised protein [Klebsiella pneumoniae]|nr:Uncharacterised protein [Klebsiella pneumoniae]
MKSEMVNIKQNKNKNEKEIITAPSKHASFIHEKKQYQSGFKLHSFLMAKYEKKTIKAGIAPQNIKIQEII